MEVSKEKKRAQRVSVIFREPEPVIVLNSVSFMIIILIMIIIILTYLFELPRSRDLTL